MLIHFLQRQAPKKRVSGVLPGIRDNISKLALRGVVRGRLCCRCRQDRALRQLVLFNLLLQGIQVGGDGDRGDNAYHDSSVFGAVLLSHVHDLGYGHVLPYLLLQAVEGRVIVVVDAADGQS